MSFPHLLAPPRLLHHAFSIAASSRSWSSSGLSLKSFLPGVLEEDYAISLLHSLITPALTNIAFKFIDVSVPQRRIFENQTTDECHEREARPIPMRRIMRVPLLFQLPESEALASIHAFRT
ncbi:hypothetical protein ACEPAF_9556 [Sanghuangporus sanghuang]